MTGSAGDRPRGFRRYPKPDAQPGGPEPDRPADAPPTPPRSVGRSTSGRSEAVDREQRGRGAEPAGRRGAPGRGGAGAGGERSGARRPAGGGSGAESPARAGNHGKAADGNTRPDPQDSGGIRSGAGRRGAGGDRRTGAGGSGGRETRAGRERETRDPDARSGRKQAPRAGGKSTGAADGGRDERRARGADRGETRRKTPERRNRGGGRPTDAPGSGLARSGRGTTPARSGAIADPARRVALETLRAVRERDAYANLVLPALLREYAVQGRDAALATELGYGACRTLGVLDAVIADCAGRDITEIDGTLVDILRLGVYQLLRTRIESHAAVHTSVEFARAESGTGRAGFVNAVLRRVTERTPEEWVRRLAPADRIGRLAFEYAHPEWIARAFADALGTEAGELRDLLAADDARPVVHLVARPGEITAEELALVTGGEEGRWSPYAVYLEGGDPGALEPVRAGMAAVQDEGSQLVALALTRAPLHGADGGRWLDLCAGPGGKTALLGALADIDGYRVDAVEPAPHRAELVRTATRGMPVDVHIADGRDSGLAPGYDRILVDAPCTGLGALRRRPEARWRRTPADIADLTALQRQLLTAAWELLRPGGVVVYSTCSPHLPETVAVVADTVRRTGAEQLDARPLLPGVTGLGAGPTAQLWPHRHGTDAMFVAALRKPR